MQFELVEPIIKLKTRLIDHHFKNEFRFNALDLNYLDDMSVKEHTEIKNVLALFHTLQEHGHALLKLFGHWVHVLWFEFTIHY